MLSKAKKGTPLRESASFEPSCENVVSGLTVGELLKKDINKKYGYISPIFPEAPRGWISTKFCTAVKVVDNRDNFFGWLKTGLPH